MKKLLSFILVAFFLVFSFSCAVKTSSIQLKNYSQRPMIPANQVTVYQTANEIFPLEYEEVALIESKGSMVWTSKSKMESKMKEEAGRLGANAIIIDSQSSGSAIAKGASVYFTAGIIGSRKGKAVAVFVHYERTKQREQRD